ncbi:TetR/AcrR family transcriptional regulator [Mycolicibacterium grossiae]|uniref:TetR family transcriptional regulator n=1 Tax=Mycolicibacterium grossiae TaxID=1552759 RepID=A0A1E8QCI3_9MYCO|nr:TetR/AcrR family transcriptional regulator [Mycolicibacterium grossiae]OFJ55669.1 TetR family transcriptional regulator [Mycolicibacterium grossiae]QEM43501.1 TetR/AcrR family transcriptional regulator [Mycolicibacterium grossiae]
MDWVMGTDRRRAGTERILDAATELILRHGLDAFDVDTLAAHVHCSRATVYRYAGGKKEIRDAVLLRLAAAVVDDVRRAVNGMGGTERVVTAVVVALDRIRSNPLRSMIFRPHNSANLAELHASPLLGHLAAELTGVTEDDPAAAQWIVRVVMSFAQWPMAEHGDEREAIRRFVAPAFP